MLLALDVGDKRVGSALSQGFQGNPHLTWQRGGGEAEREIGKLVKQHSIQRIIVGLPLNEEGALTAQCKKIFSFCRRLKRRVGIPIEFVDEYLSSKEAEEAIFGPGFRKKKKGMTDSASAAIILNAYLKDKNVIHYAKWESEGLEDQEKLGIH